MDWGQIKLPMETVGFIPWFYFPGQPILVPLFDPQPCHPSHFFCRIPCHFLLLPGPAAMVPRRFKPLDVHGFSPGRNKKTRGLRRLTWANWMFSGLL